MTAAPFTRYYCPLECGWHYDQTPASPGEGLPEPLAQRPDESFQDLITCMAGDTARAHMQKMDDVLRDHLSTHTMIQAVTKLAEVRNEQDGQKMYAHGEDNGYADWDIALDGLLPADVEALPTRVATYLRDLQAENARLRQITDRTTEA